jgi:hypothetical protein
MKKETMQAVTYHCDVCGVKLPVAGKEVSMKTEDLREFKHFVMVINEAVVRETFLMLGDGPSHGRGRIQEPHQIDVCQGCSKFPLSYIIQKAVEEAEKRP